VVRGEKKKPPFFFKKEGFVFEVKQQSVRPVWFLYFCSKIKTIVE
jgi:hypothetical protein